MNVIREACVESLDQCLAAEKNGAERIELCADLAKDGLTPDETIIEQVKEQVNIPVRVMVRPKAGDFVYTEAELLEMKSTIDLCKANQLDGVVFGICKADGKSLDIEKISELATYAKPLKVTIHKAIDVSTDPIGELVQLTYLGTIDSVLTSGKAATAVEGITVLKKMVAVGEDKLEIIACGKVTNENLKALHEKLGARAYHGKLIVGKLE